ncbi:MAG: hypothetical protein KGO53_07030 [Alphaproteobacteria bacterium]|nr:hypothetical protein [Alphaproteobacteria bacterium]
MKLLASISLMGLLMSPLGALAADTSTPEAPMNYAADVAVGMSYDGWTNVGDYNHSPIANVSSFYGTFDGRALVPLSSNVGVQFDGSMARTFDGGDIATWNNASHMGAHLLYRTDAYQFGVFGGFGVANVHNGGGEEEWQSRIFGIEGQAYLNNVTLWAQLAKAGSFETSGPSEIFDPIQLRAGSRYFLDANTRLDVEGGYATAPSAGDFAATASMVNWKVGVEHLFELDSHPVSVFANYTGSKVLDANDVYYSIGNTETAVNVGFSFKFGPHSLIDEDRHGTNTDMSFSKLPVMDSLYTAPLP